MSNGADGSVVGETGAGNVFHLVPIQDSACCCAKDIPTILLPRTRQPSAEVQLDGPQLTDEDSSESSGEFRIHPVPCHSATSETGEESPPG